MNQRNVVLVGIVIGVLALSFFAYRSVAQGKRENHPPELHIEKDTETDKQLRQIKAVASAGELVEARLEDEGWVVAATDTVDTVTPYQIFERTRVFFRNLRSTNVPLKSGTFTLTTDTIKDEWGHPKLGEVVIRVVFETDSFYKVNWNTIDPHNIRLVADEIWLHEGVIEIIQEQERKQNQSAGLGPGPSGIASGGSGQSGGGATSGGGFGGS